uniref:Regulator of chromosome condensation protein n=1 Tax=Pithovirus LCPAC101 TaxID=2506586 RepID=A0A481Z2Q8_9VIRU|nr:MAG: regulator of chromosome condensation protein [Pithovirus LCPAC101]
MNFQTFVKDITTHISNKVGIFSEGEEYYVQHNIKNIVDYTYNISICVNPGRFMRYITFKQQKMYKNIQINEGHFGASILNNIIDTAERYHIEISTYKLSIDGNILLVSFTVVTEPSYLLSLPSEILELILQDFSYNETISMCLVHPNLLHRIYNSKQFWKLKFLNKTGSNLTINVDPKQAVLNYGKLLVFGDNKDGKLGIKGSSIVHTPTCIPGINRVDTVYSGQFTTVYKNDDDKYFEAGDFIFAIFGMKHLEFTKYNPFIHPVYTLDMSAIKSISFMPFMPFTLRRTPLPTKELKLVLDKYGKLLIQGDMEEAYRHIFYDINDPNECSFVCTSLNPTKLTNIKSISAGVMFVAYIDNNNDLYIMGINNIDQLGYQTSTNLIGIPKLVMSNVKSVECGPCSMMVLDNKNMLWVSGNNYHGGLGIGNNIHQIDLVMVDTSYPVIKRSCGISHSAFIDNNLKLWVMGNNKNGRVGLGKDIDSVNIPTPLMDEKQFIQVKCGANYTIVLDVNNDVYVFGDNSMGQLGLGKDVDEQFVPTLLKLSHKIEQIYVNTSSYSVLLKILY